MSMIIKNSLALLKDSLTRFHACAYIIVITTRSRVKFILVFVWLLLDTNLMRTDNKCHQWWYGWRIDNQPTSTIPQRVTTIEVQGVHFGREVGQFCTSWKWLVQKFTEEQPLLGEIPCIRLLELLHPLKSLGHW